MLGRCRLRRGVSLEVIVEEDDNAEVSFDPEPLMEEDDDDDEYDDSENGTGGSAPSSPREDDGRGGRGDGSAEGRSSIDERRKKRERRRTIGGLSRIRSVSCEALTLLDTSDMDSCCSEWDDDDELAASSSSNYVTLNRPISRRRIIESSQSQCDSEDSGIEYHSNEDDHVLEEHSSNEDHVEEDEEDQQEQEEEEEEEEGLTSINEAPTEEEDNLQDDQEEEGDEEEEEEGSATITTESDDDVGESPSEAQQQDVDETLLSATTGKELFDEYGKQAHKQEQKNHAPAGKFDYSPNEALENNKIIIVEKTTPTPIKKPQQVTQSGLETAEEEMRLKREAYTIRNKEVRLAELPRPHTVKSVKQLFENLNTPVQHFHTWRDLGRFRDIKSNPSSKILRFDRNDGNDVSVSRNFLMSSLTLPRLPSQGGHQKSSTKTTNNAKTFKNKSTHEAETTKKVTTPKTPKTSQETPISRILKQSQSVSLQRERVECHSAKSESKSQEPLQQVKTQSGQKVVLRKPIVKGFNVKKALMENPRNFLPNNHNNQQQQQQQQQQQNSHNNIRQRLGHLSKSHHHSETTDRSDTESLASDISDDSGVSNDSLASTTSPTPSSYRAFDAYASDPSFKWIDPAVMAKIRSVGTTVIFFGPRPRPRHEGSLQKGTRSTSSGLQFSRGLNATHGGKRVSRSDHPMSQSNKKQATRLQEQTNVPIPAPRIVGVVRKLSPSISSASATTSANTSPSPSIHHTPAPTPTPTETHSDDSRASSPASRCEDENITGKAGRWRAESDTIVYNFTRPQPPAVYF